MKLLQFARPGETTLRLGVATAGGVLDVAAEAALRGLEGVPVSLADAIAAADGPARLAPLLERPRTGLLPEKDLRLGPAIAAPEKIICIGLNYRRHAEEAKMAVPATPVLFSKFNNAIAAPGEAVRLPGNASHYDYEVELGVVIGRKAQDVPTAEALAHVFGYCTLNDLSARDLQMRTPQWLLGKTLDGFLPAGPYLVTADEVGDPQRLRLRCLVNGAVRQDSTTADMIFSVAEIVSYASRYMTLKPGDVISTGTPEGVIFGMKDKVWLVPGDEVTCEIERLGRLTNRLIA